MFQIYVDIIVNNLPNTGAARLVRREKNSDRPTGDKQMLRRSFLKTTALATVATLSFSTFAFAENAVLKIGFVGVTSGPAAAWGISNQRSMETRAA